jgi:hypothetical protein
MLIIGNDFHSRYERIVILNAAKYESSMPARRRPRWWGSRIRATRCGLPN